MRVEEVNQLIKSIQNIEIKTAEAAGSAVLVELRMRLLAELHETLREVLEEKLKNKKRENKYWNCKLLILEETIEQVFSDELSRNELEKINLFRDARNKLLHADLVGLMKVLNLEPAGRQILPKGGRKMLEESNIREAIISIDRSRGLQDFRKLAGEVAAILDRIIWGLC